MANTIIHTVKVQLLQRSTNQVQTTVTSIEKDFTVSEKAFISTRIKQADNLKTFSFSPVELPTYILVVAKYLVDNVVIGAVAGDLAPITIRLNGSLEDIDASKGFVLIGGEATGLQVSTTIVDDIEVSLYMAGI